MSPLAKIGVGLAAVVLLAVLLQACLLGGDGGSSIGSIGRLGSVVTATPPATLPTPLLLGQSQGGNATASGTTTASGGGAYTVKSGDTLGSIATALGIPPELQAAWIADVLRLNGITDPRLIGAGQELNLPRTPVVTVTGTARATDTAQATGTTSSAATATRTPTPGATTAAAPTATRPATGGGTYTVV